MALKPAISPEDIRHAWTTAQVEVTVVAAGTEPVRQPARDEASVTTGEESTSGEQDLRRGVALGDIPSALRSTLALRLGSGDLSVERSQFVKVVEHAADFLLQARNGFLEVMDSRELQVLARYPITDEVDAVVERTLNHMARFRNIVELRNDAEATAGLANTVTLEIHRQESDDRANGRMVAAPDRAILVEDGTAIYFEITNLSQQPLFVSLLSCTADWAVTVLYDADTPLQPGASLFWGRSQNASEQVVASLPQGAVEARDTLKLIATAQAADMRLLEQGELDSPPRPTQRSSTPAPFRNIAAQVEQTGRQPPATEKLANTLDTDVGAAWTTAQLDLWTVRRLADSTVQIGEDATHALSEFSLTIETAPLVYGWFRCLTFRQLLLADSTERLRLASLDPQILATTSILSPLPVGALNLSPHIGEILEAEVVRVPPSEADYRDSGPPLRLRLQGEQAANQGPLLALAQADGLYYLAGRGDGSSVTQAEEPATSESALSVSVDIDWLPSLLPFSPSYLEVEPDGDVAGQAESEGRFAALRLYRLHESYTRLAGLYATRFVSDEADTEVQRPDGSDAQAVRTVRGGSLHYHTPRRDSIRSRDRVAVVIPGLGQDASHIAAWLGAEPAGEHTLYEHILTFEYDPGDGYVGERAKELDVRLADLGFGPDDGVQLDLFAHGSGALIVRCLVELFGGDRYVERAFLAGPPNRGSFDLFPERDPWLWLTFLALNFADFWEPWPLADWTAGAALLEFPLLDDLRPGSKLLEQLQQSRAEIVTDYYLLIGDTDEPVPTESDWVSEQSGYGDWVTSPASMQTMPPYPNVTTRVVACHYFDYFSSPAALQVWRQWLASDVLGSPKTTDDD